MKKYLSYLGASLVAIAALSSCNKELADPNEGIKGGIPFEICASTAETRTTIDEAFKTTWVVDGTADQINVYHKDASATEYTSDNAFTAQSVDGKFSGTLTSVLEAEKKYQWLAKYPYDSYLTTPAKGYSYIGSRSDQTQSQTGVNNTAHLSGYYMPLVGKGASVGTASPTITMEHASSVIEINVTNNTSEALDVTSIVFTAPESIIGQFVIDYTGETTTYTEKTYVSAIATLSVTDGTIAAGKSGKFYIAIKPFSATSEQKLSLSVNGYSKEIPHSSDVTFTAGKIKKINFNYDNTAVVNTATFDFSDPGSLGLVKPSASAGTNITSNIVVGDVTLSTTNGSTATRIWNSQGTCDLRVYNSGGSLTFSVPEGSVITNIVFTGDAASSGYSASVGTLSSGTWTGRNQSVKFTASNSLKISTAVVTYSAGKANTSIISDDITAVSARGVSAGESSYTIENPVDGTTISATCDGTVVTAVTADAGTIHYDVSANKTTSVREGSITLTYGDVTKIVKVSQLAPVFKVSRTSVELEAAANSSATITVTSDFDWTSDTSAGAGFTSDPATCKWTTENPYTDGKTTVTIKATAENTSEEGTKTLGTLTFKNLSTEETLVVTVTQKTSYVAPSTGTEVTFTMTTSGDFSTGTTATKDVITIAGGQGSYSSNISVGSSYTKVYAGNTLTISGTAGTKITKVVFSATSNYIKTWSANDNSECVVSSTDNTMTWNNALGVESVIFTNTATGQARVKTIVVTYE